MARPRKPRAARKSRAPRVTGNYMATTGSVGGGELGEAAEEIAAGARGLAAWSTQVAGGIHVDAGESSATIWTDAPPAYPNETGARHPVFARGARDKWTWVKGDNRPFLGPAADLRAGAAMAKYARKIDRLCRERGFS
jgi:hypothetical protein